jgi:hypothetical protein
MATTNIVVGIAPELALDNGVLAPVTVGNQVVRFRLVFPAGAVNQVAELMFAFGKVQRQLVLTVLELLHGFRGPPVPRAHNFYNFGFRLVEFKGDFDPFFGSLLFQHKIVRLLLR